MGTERGRRSASAQHVALARALHTRAGHLDDPHAAAMLRPPWRAVLAATRGPLARRARADLSLAFLAVRTRYVDAAVVAALDGGARQVLTLGAGYDSRPWRLARPGVRWVELDAPATQADKRRRAPGGEGPAYVAHSIGSAPLAPALAGAGWDPGAPSVVVAEGLVMYLAEEVVAALLADLREAVGPGSHLVVNFGVGFAADESGAGERWTRRVLRAGRERFRCELAAEEVAPFLAVAGWEPVEVLTGPQAAARHLVGTGLPTATVGPRSTLVTARCR